MLLSFIPRLFQVASISGSPLVRRKVLFFVDIGPILRITTCSKVPLNITFDCKRPRRTSIVRRTHTAFAMTSPSSNTAAFTTQAFFLSISLPKSQHTTRTACSLTEVGSIYKSMFHSFKVKPWPNFNKNAARILTGDNAKTLSDNPIKELESAKRQLRRNPPRGEVHLTSLFRQVVLETANAIQDETGESELRWSHGSYIRTTPNQPSLMPDISLHSRGSGSSSQSRNLPVVAGELKLPCYSLGSTFTAKDLTRRIQHRDYLEDAGLNPFFQALSYAINSQKGVALLSNFDENRYLKVNIRSKEIWISDLVKVDQCLNQSSETPHALQALLYTGKMEDPDKKEFSATLVKGLVTKGEQILKAEKDRKDEEGKKKKPSSSRADGAGGSKDHGRFGSSKKRSNSLFPPVSLVLQRCKMVGLLGEGITGEVSECNYDGQKVAVKIGSKNHSSDLDCMHHVENEIAIYKVLKDLQGSVIPRMIEGGLDTVYSASIVLITEKVGMGVEEADRTITVGGNPLDRENLIIFKQKGLEGLRKMRARGVIHGDKCTRNMRVEMRDGRVDRVCWLDFGEARVFDDARKIKEGAASKDNGEIEAKSEASEELDYPEATIETLDTMWFEDFVDKFISYTEE